MNDNDREVIDIAELRAIRERAERDQGLAWVRTIKARLAALKRNDHA
jgi:hypothetical protein